MRRLIVASLALLITGVSVQAAEPYVGRWSHDEKLCAPEPDSEDAAMQITPTEIVYIDAQCRIDSSTFDGEKTYLINATCRDGAGDPIGRKHLKWELADSQTIIQTDLDNPPKNNFETDIQFRCMASGMHPSPDE